MQQEIDPAKLEAAFREMNNHIQELRQKEAQRQARELADKIIDTQTAILSAGFDKAATYTNLVVLAGYATYFALWSQVKDHLTPITELLSALFMLASALTFVLFEVYKMFYIGRTFHLQRSILIDDSNEEPRPYRRGLLKVQAALDPSPARPGAGHTAESWLR